MSENKYDFLGVKMEVEELLRGFGPGAYAAGQGTCFKWKENIGPLNNGQIAWVKKRLAAWCELVNKVSGVTILNQRQRGEYNEFDNAFGQMVRNKYWDLEFEFSIPGALNPKALHPAVAEFLPGQWKKFLAEELFRRFPLGIKDGDDKEPLFQAKCGDIIVFKPQSAPEKATLNAKQVFFSEEFKYRLQTILTDYGAELLLLKDMARLTTKMWECQIIVMRWLADTQKSKRSKLQHDLRKAISELGATYQSQGRESDCYLVKFYR